MFVWMRKHDFPVAIILSLAVHGFLFWGPWRLPFFFRQVHASLEVAYLPVQVLLSNTGTSRPAGNMVRTVPHDPGAADVRVTGGAPAASAQADPLSGPSVDPVRETVPVVTVPPASSVPAASAGNGEQPAVSARERDPQALDGTDEERALQVSYRRYVRERIRSFLKSAYARDLGEGEVTVSFTLLQSGALGQVAIDKAHSVPNGRLQRITLHGVQRAAPFPPFPAQITAKELSFSLAIVFERE